MSGTLTLNSPFFVMQLCGCSASSLSAAVEELKIEPAVVLDGVPRYDDAAVGRLAEHFRKLRARGEQLREPPKRRKPRK